ncbi:hypothetical protein GBAR_LOCUS22337 [Geodia barretti]|uniref:Uncharacterized protein n=1 Tax=Geodia barretti TaxID=519541 RepID=A0AA35T328_GEOBA|nr:hypothetical protein GBAR_LOCUS22337 [Geodia barretti]
MTCGSPNSSLASLCFHKHNPYLVSLSFYTIPICTLFLIRRIFYLLVSTHFYILLRRRGKAPIKINNREKIVVMEMKCIPSMCAAVSKFDE